MTGSAESAGTLHRGGGCKEPAGSCWAVARVSVGIYYALFSLAAGARGTQLNGRERALEEEGVVWWEGSFV